MHKGFKCLDISSGRIYISRDVIFDENVFPFASLNPNAGARLRAEVIQLSDTTWVPLAFSRGEHVAIPCANDSLDGAPEVCDLQDSNPGENHGAIAPESALNKAPAVAEHEEDPAPGGAGDV